MSEMDGISPNNPQLHKNKNKMNAAMPIKNAFQNIFTDLLMW